MRRVRISPVLSTGVLAFLSSWLFFSNSTRYASAMTGAADYAAFHHGWWDLTNNLLQMRSMIDLKQAASKNGGQGQ